MEPITEGCVVYFNGRWRDWNYGCGGGTEIMDLRRDWNNKLKDCSGISDRAPGLKKQECWAG